MREMLETELCALSYCATSFAFASFFVLRQGLNQLVTQASFELLCNPGRPFPASAFR